MSVVEKTLALLAEQDADTMFNLAIRMQLDEKQIETRRGKKRLLHNMILRHLTSPEVEDLEDEGLSLYLDLKTAIETTASMQKVLKDEFPDIKPSTNYSSSPSRTSRTPGSPIVASLTTKLREFKINGKIGQLGEKDRLSYTSLIFQISNGQKKGYSEDEICEAIVKSMCADLPIKTYLEGQVDLKLKTLAKLLRIHFHEQDAAAVFQSLSSARQAHNESPYNFVVRLMNVRQKVLFVSYEGLARYPEKLVQGTFLHSVLTGLRSETLRSELRPLLESTDTTDELLLEKLSVAVLNEKEHQEKFTIQKKSVNKVEVEDVHSKQKSKTNELVCEIKSLKTQVEELTSLKDDFKTFKNNATGNFSEPRNSSDRPGISYSPGPPRLNNSERQSSDYYRRYDEPPPSQYRRNAGYRRSKPPPFFQNRRSRFICEQCKKENRSDCEHCFKCGSIEHFSAGCKKN